MDKRAEVAAIGSGATVMIDSFSGSDTPIELIHALIDNGSWSLTVINNNAVNGYISIAAKIDAGMARKIIFSLPRLSGPLAFTEIYFTEKVVLELVPPPTVAERIRADGARIPAFYKPTAHDTELAERKAVSEFDGRSYVQEYWLKADFTLIKAYLSDYHGNLNYRMGARNFSPLMCVSAASSIVQAAASCRSAGPTRHRSLHLASLSTASSKSLNRNRKSSSFTKEPLYIIANSRVGAKGGAVDGETDFVRGAKQDVVVTEHLTMKVSRNSLKYVRFLSRGGSITRIYTSHAVIDIEQKSPLFAKRLPVSRLKNCN